MSELERLPRLAQVKRYLRDEHWVYARTMPRWPHEYVLLERSHDPELHLRVLAYIRAHGVERRFGRNRQMYAYWRNPEDGREYWAMPGHTIINRERDAGSPRGAPERKNHP